MYELKAGEVIGEFEEAISLHSQFGPIMYIVAKGHRPMLCYLVDPLKKGKIEILDKKGRIHVTDGKREKKIPLVKIQRVMFFGLEELLEIMRSLLGGIDDLVERTSGIGERLNKMKSKILDLGLVLNKPWIKL